MYQYLSDPSLMDKDSGKAAPGFTAAALNQTLIRKFLLDPSNTKNFHIAEGTSFVWVDDLDKCIVALYPDILFEGPRQYLKDWATSLVHQTMREYELYQKASEATADPSQIRLDPAPFDKTFRALLNQSKAGAATTSSSASKPTTTTTAAAAADKTSNKKTNKKSGKEKRTWGEAKVTEAAMAELDMSKKDETSADAVVQAQERALAEARAAYLPTSQDLQVEQEQQEAAKKEPSWSSTATGWFQQMTGNKVLEAKDLGKPLDEMQAFLTSKNVAAEIAQELCQAVQQRLVGKKLNSLYRVQTAVQQALETTITKLLHHDVDLLRNALSKRGDSLFSSVSSSASKKKPYVVAVVGINGVGTCNVNKKVVT